MLFSIQAAILATTLAYAIGSRHFNVNKQMDTILPGFNNYLAKKEIEVSGLPDFGYPASPVFIGVNLRNLTTIYRTGDCEVWADGDNLKLKMNLGLKDMVANVYFVPYMKGPAAFDFKGASAEIGVTLIPINNKGNCRTSWDYIKINTLGTVIGHSMNKEYDGKPLPEEIIKDLINYYNKYLNDNEMYSIKKLDQFINLCDENLVVDTFVNYVTL